MAFSGQLNILLGVHEFLPKYRAGTEVLTLELARGLRERGHFVQIVAGEPEPDHPISVNPWINQDEYDGFIVHRFHYGIADIQSNLSLDQGETQRVPLLKGLVSTLKPDIVHFNHIIGFSPNIVAEIRKMGIPVIFTPTDYWIVCPNITLLKTDNKTLCAGPSDGSNCLHCFQVLDNEKLKKRLTTMMENVNFANRVLPATKFLADILVSNGLNPDLVSIIPYGVDIGKLPDKPVIPEHFSEKEPLQVGYIGNLAERKGLHVILDSFAYMAEEQQKLVLAVYGEVYETNPYCQLLREKAKKLDARIEFRGTFPHEKIGEILRTMHLLIVPSIWYESTPLVLCGGLAAGIPVLVSRLGGMTEVLNEEINGFSFTAGSGLDLSKIICRILNNPSILINMQKLSKAASRRTCDYVIDIESQYFKTLSL